MDERAANLLNFQAALLPISTDRVKEVDLLYQARLVSDSQLEPVDSPAAAALPVYLSDKM